MTTSTETFNKLHQIETEFMSKNKDRKLLRYEKITDDTELEKFFFLKI